MVAHIGGIFFEGTGLRREVAMTLTPGILIAAPDSIAGAPLNCLISLYRRGFEGLSRRYRMSVAGLKRLAPCRSNFNGCLTGSRHFATYMFASR